MNKLNNGLVFKVSFFATGVVCLAIGAVFNVSVLINVSLVILTVSFSSPISANVSIPQN